jgi:hypothetical protein
MRSTAQRNPATAAARGDDALPYIRDNLYTGARQTRVVRQLRSHGIIEIEGDTMRVLDRDRYMRWLERAYWHHGHARLDPRVRRAIERYVDRGTITTVGVRPGGGRAFSGQLPGTHAEVLAINASLAGGAGRIDVATLRAKYGGHFAACLHCAGIIGELADVLPELRVLTGVSAP